MKTKVHRFTLICVVRISPAQKIQSLKKIFTPNLNFSKLLPEPLKPRESMHPEIENCLRLNEREPVLTIY